MNVVLSKCSCENNRLNKSNYLSDPITLSGEFRDSINKMNGTILVQYTNPLNDYNYLYIPLFNRYYYVTSIDAVRNDLLKLTLKTDVLMTYRQSILNCDGVVARNENLYNTMIIDDHLRFLGYKQINTIKLSGQLKNGETFILAVNGR